MSGDCNKIALVGLSGSGKSTIAPVLASRFGLGTSIDLDRVIEEMFSDTIESIFVSEGETRFREFESDALATALATSPVVVATGGGCVMDRANRALLRSDDVITIWLRASTSELVSRLRDTTEARPLLAGDPGFALQRLAEQREALYQEVADFVVDVDGSDVRSVVDDIEAFIRARCP